MESCSSDAHSSSNSFTAVSAAAERATTLLAGWHDGDGQWKLLFYGIGSWRMYLVSASLSSSTWPVIS